jgi:drug/metabolite transporter (DMT)-like permease
MLSGARAVPHPPGRLPDPRTSLRQPSTHPLDVPPPAGYTKTLFIIAGGWLWFHEAMQPLKALGVGLAMAGLATYSWAKLNESQQAPQSGQQLNGATKG